MWMPPVLRVFASPDHSLAHSAKLDGALPDYVHRFCGAGDPHGSLLISPLIGMLQKPTPARGLMLQGGAGKYAGKRTLGADLPGPRDHAGRITI